jgi:DNA replication factor GINS
MPLNTYQNIARVLGDLKGKQYGGIEERVRDRMVSMISISTNILLEIRYHKILEQQQSNELPLNSKKTGMDYSKLTDEEKYILNGKKESDKRKISVLGATLEGRVKVLESISEKIRFERIVVRFLEPMEQFIGIDMTKYGPFREEDVAVLPFENARSLIENDKVVEIQIA